MLSHTVWCRIRPIFSSGDYLKALYCGLVIEIIVQMEQEYGNVDFVKMCVSSMYILSKIFGNGSAQVYTLHFILTISK